MSHNESRGDQVELQSRKSGRSGGIAPQAREYLEGGGGRGGGSASHVPGRVPSNAFQVSSLPPSRSFKRPGNEQGGQFKGQPAAVPQAGVAVPSRSVPAVANGPQDQPSMQASGISMASKPVELSVPKPSRAVPRPPSQPSASALDATTYVTKGDAGKPFTLQFGSIALNVVNGMQVPARTSSAPPNLDEQKKDQAIRAMHTPPATLPLSSVSKQHLNPIGSSPANSGITHTTTETMKDSGIPTSIPPTGPQQKFVNIPVSGQSMPTFQQQTQSSLPFGSQNIPIQSQHVSAGSMQMQLNPLPMGPHPSIFMNSHHSHVVLSGHNIGFSQHYPQCVAPPGLGSVGIPVGTQYQPVQAGQTRSSTPIKITHPVTHEVLKLDKKIDAHIDPSGQRCNLPSQIHPPSFPTQGNYLPNQGPFQNFYHPQVSSSQPTLSQASRISITSPPSGTHVSIVDPSTRTSVPGRKPGITIQKDSELLQPGHSHSAKVPHVSATPQAGENAFNSDGESRPSKPLQDAGLMHWHKGGGSTIVEISGDQTKVQVAKVEVFGAHLNSHVKSTGLSCKSTDNQHPPISLPAFYDKKTESCTSTPLVVTESLSLLPVNVEKKELPSSDSPKDGNSKLVIVNKRLPQQEHREATVDSSSSLNVSRSSLNSESHPSRLSDKCVQETSKHTNLLETNKMPAVDILSSEGGMPATDGEKNNSKTTEHPGVIKVEKGDKDVHFEALNSALTNGTTLGSEPLTDVMVEVVPCREQMEGSLDVIHRGESSQVAETLAFTMHDSSVFDGPEVKQNLISVPVPPSDRNITECMIDKDASNPIITSEQLPTQHDLKNASVEVGVTIENNNVNVEPITAKIQDNLTVVESKTDSITDLSVANLSSSKTLCQEPVLDTDTSVKTSSQVYRSSAMVGKSSIEVNNMMKPIAGKKKKKKDMLSRADAAGTNSDLYMAYKGPEEYQVVPVLSDNIDNSSINDGKNLQCKEMEGITSREEGQSKTDIDDWEDAAEIPSPKLEIPENFGQTYLAKERGPELGALSSKKYSRDFLLTFLDQCLNLPPGFEIKPDIAPLFQVGSSHVASNEHLAGIPRVIDRPHQSLRDRRMMGYSDDEKWAKPMNVSTPRDGFRPGAGATYGVLRNLPRGQGGILPGQIQPLVPQGIPHNVDADRLQRATRGLIPSPQTPGVVIHKAERRYEVGKISDAEVAKQRQIKAILNKLTPQNFDRLFCQVKEVNIDNAFTLAGVISQIFDKALAEPTFCEMYADFCRHLAGELPDFYEGNDKITFRRLLLNKCQEEFERGEKEEAEAEKMEEDGELEKTEKEKEEKRVQARRRMLGNIRLIGELYKNKMLTERIMHACINKLLGPQQNPDEEDIEALCKLMSTIGKIIDHEKAKEHIDAYFEIMKNLSDDQKFSSRVRFMLKDVIDLRKNGWKQRRKVEGPKKIEEVHRDAAQERAHVGRPARGSGMGSSARKGSTPAEYGTRSSIPLSSSTQHTVNVRTIPSQSRNFGSQDVRLEERLLYDNRTPSVPLSQRPIADNSITLGPQGGLAKGMSSRGQPLMPNLPPADATTTTGETGKSGFGPNGSSIAERNALLGVRDLGRIDRMSDRSSNKISLDSTSSSSAGSGGVSPQYVQLSDEELHRKCIYAIKEYYSAKDEKEVGMCIKELNCSNYHPAMVSLWITDSFERKDFERELLSKLLVNLCKSEDRILSQAELVEGFELVLSTLEDVIPDAPRAPEFIGRIFVSTILEDVVTFKEIGRLLLEGGEERGRLLEIGLAGEVLGNVLETIRMDKGDSIMREIRISSNVPLESFRQPSQVKYRKLEQFL